VPFNGEQQKQQTTDYNNKSDGMDRQTKQRKQSQVAHPKAQKHYSKMSHIAKFG